LGMGWPDGSHVSYGGAGHPAFGATGPDCSFMYPYNSDPCNWGTAGIQPTGFSTGAGGSGPFWTEAQAGNVPYDVRGLGLCGSFSMAPGEVKTLDMALVFGRNYIDTNAFAGLSVVNQRIDQIRNYYNQNTTPCGNWYVGLDDNAPKPDRGIRVFPNPARNSVNIECTNIGKNQDFSIFNLIGLEVRKGILLDNTVNLLNISDLKPGVYFLRIRNETVKKFVVNR